MKKEIGFIAIGQAGGNIGKLFEKTGYTVLYINTSEEDLKTLPDAAHKYHLEGGEGCNKDRTKAKRLLARNIEKVMKEVSGKVPQNMVFTIFSAGGGTGSGIGPMLTEILRQETDKMTGAITILPNENESVKTHVNAWDCVRELADIEETGACFFIDNNTTKAKMKLNEIFVRLLDDFISIPEKRASTLGNIDRAEIKEVLSAKGAALISRTSRQDTTTARVIEQLRRGIFADLDEVKAVKYMAVSAAGSQASINMQVLQAEFGTAYDIFQGFEAEQTICCLSGLRFPFSRMEKIKQKAMENQGDIVNSLNAVNMNPMSEGLDLFARVKKPEKRKGSSRDLLQKFL